MNTRDKSAAAAIAAQLRESGRAGRPGEFKFCKAIGWYVEEYGRAQISMNLTNYRRRIEWKSSINVDAFTFLKSITHATPKVTLPAPTQVHFFAGTTGISKTVYPDIEQFWDDMVAAYRAELQALGQAGCTYVQIDETCLPKLADPAIQQVAAKRGDDWRAVTRKYAEIINRIIASAPAGMHIAIHHCRGNNAGLWQAQAGYDAVAEIIFNEIKAPAYLLEYDSSRAGDFAPLRFMPKDKTVVLGLVSTKTTRIEIFG